MSEDYMRPDSEFNARQRMIEAEAAKDYEAAAIAALVLADYIGARTAEGANVCVGQAHVYASLHQAATALFIAENRQPAMFFEPPL